MIITFVFSTFAKFRSTVKQVPLSSDELLGDTGLLSQQGVVLLHAQKINRNIGVNVISGNGGVFGQRQPLVSGRNSFICCVALNSVDVSSVYVYQPAAVLRISVILL